MIAASFQARLSASLMPVLPPRAPNGLSLAAPVRCVQVLGSDEPARVVEHVRDPQGHLQGACHVFGHAWALIRPDSYVAATGEGIDATLVHAVGVAMGTPLHGEEA